MNQQHIRNFVIISHIDHGKSTLADRLLEYTGTVADRNMQEQVLDHHPLERERGITIKMSPARMNYEGYILNLIDTPGHADFGYEVSRALAAVEGAVLLVDATAGVQAQTVSNAMQAVEQELTIIPVVNKIDLPHADVIGASVELQDLLGITDDPLCVSAKTGEGVPALMEAILERVPAPRSGGNHSLRALVFDSHYDAYKGIVAHVRVVDGVLERGMSITMAATSVQADGVTPFILTPGAHEVERLESGMIGAVATGIKEADSVMVGDTVTTAVQWKAQNTKHKAKMIEPLAGYKEPQPVVFAGMFPDDQDYFEALRTALHRLRLNDAALQIQPSSAVGLGRGFRCGLLGLLHLEIVQQRLERDEGVSVIVTPPSVVVRVRRGDGVVSDITAPTDLPLVDDIADIEEPWIATELLVPNDRLGDVMRLLDSIRGEHGDTVSLGAHKTRLHYTMPMATLLRGFYDDLKRVTSGFASFSYKDAGYRPADLVRLDVLVNEEFVPTLSVFVAEHDGQREARRTAELLKKLIPPQLIPIPIQVKIGVRRSPSGGWTAGDIIARETKRALKKDVTAGLYGGDVTRKRKLREKQKKGKKKMQERGGADIPADVYSELLRKR